MIHIRLGKTARNYVITAGITSRVMWLLGLVSTNVVLGGLVTNVIKVNTPLFLLIYVEDDTYRSEQFYMICLYNMLY